MEEVYIEEFRNVYLAIENLNNIAKAIARLQVQIEKYRNIIEGNEW